MNRRAEYERELRREKILQQFADGATVRLASSAAANSHMTVKVVTSLGITITTKIYVLDELADDGLIAKTSFDGYTNYTKK